MVLMDNQARAATCSLLRPCTISDSTTDSRSDNSSSLPGESRTATPTEVSGTASGVTTGPAQIPRSGSTGAADEDLEGARCSADKEHYVNLNVRRPSSFLV